MGRVVGRTFDFAPSQQVRRSSLNPKSTTTIPFGEGVVVHKDGTDLEKGVSESWKVERNRGERVEY